MEQKDYLNETIAYLMTVQKYSFWMIKKHLANQKVELDKTVLFNRIKKVIKNKL